MSLKQIQAPKDPIPLEDNIEITLIYSKEKQISEDFQVQILYQNDIIAGNQAIDIKVLENKLIIESDHYQLKIKYCLQELGSKGDHFLKRCQENLGRLDIKIGTSDGSTIKTSIVIMVYNDEQLNERVSALLIMK